MKTLFSQLNGLELFFLICAIVGGLFVIIRLAMQLMGMGHDDGGQFHDGGDGFDGDHADSDLGFKMLSLHGLTSFLMMFGLVGLAMYRESRMGVAASMAGAVGAGLASVWVIKKLFNMLMKLQSSGNISTESAVGCQGKVYLTIPEKGTGRVLVTVQNRLREYDAVSGSEQKIDTDTVVRVLWVDGDVLVVEKI